MHELHVELYATSPVRHRVVDTIISFTHEKDIHSSRIDFDQITSTVQSNRYGVNRNQDAHIEITEDEQDSIGECAEIVIGECSSNVIREHTVHHPVQKSTVFSIEEAKLELVKMRNSIKVRYPLERRILIGAKAIIVRRANSHSACLFVIGCFPANQEDINCSF